MLIYIVCEHDQGFGPIMIKAFYSREEAEKFNDSEFGGDYIEEVELEEKND